MTVKLKGMPSSDRPVVLLAALDQEAAALARRLIQSARTSPGLSIWEGELEGRPVALVLTGMGKVAAALATQFACDVFAPRCLLTIGLAGGVESVGAPGLVIVASGAVQHDMDARPLTEARGVIPGSGKWIWPAELHADLLRAAQRVVDAPGVLRSGMVMTGDQIITSREVRDRTLAHFPDGACFDMETAAVAQVAYQNGIPWGGVRVISDAADESFDLGAVLGFGTNTAAELFDRIVSSFLVEA